MNKIQKLFNKYNDECYEYFCEPATQEQLQIFIENCNERNIPVEIINGLADYYKFNNKFFGYFKCDDTAIFQWLEYGCLWLGQRDLWSFRCLLDKHKYSIGDASNDSFGKDYEFDTIEEMLEAFLSGDKI